MNFSKSALRLILFSAFLFLNQLSQGQHLLSFQYPDTMEYHMIKDTPAGLKIYDIETMDQANHEMNPYVQLLKPSDNELKAEDLMKPEWNIKFKPLHPDSINCTTCVYWGRMAIKNNTKSRLNQWILYLGKASKLDVYIFNEKESLISTQQTGRSVAASQKPLLHGNRLERVLLNFSEHELLYIFFRIESTNGYLPELRVKLSNEDYFKSGIYNRRMILDGLFIGFLCSLILFNLIFYLTTRDVAFFYQFVFVICVLIFIMDIMDLICDFPFLRDHPPLHEPINFASLVLLNISYLHFVNKFIAVEKIFPKWSDIINRLVQLNLILGSGIIVFYLITRNEKITDTAIALVCTVQYTCLLILLFQFFRIRDKKSYFILVATLFLIGGVIVDGICIVLGLSVPINFSKIIVLGNVSFFFFGLAYRMKMLKEEEHEAIRLKENQELKNNLYANITHEFRTPLTVIQGMAQQIELKSTQQDTSRLQKAIFLIKSNSSRLLNLVNTILDLAKLESGKMNLRLVQGDIISFLRYAVQLFEGYAGSKKIYLQFLTELDRLEMDYDRDKIQQIISNLISNAIKFTPAGGKIYFAVKRIELNHLSHLQLEVKDTGEGIPTSILSSLFDRFFQAESSKHKSQGSGLGLALVKELVRLMEGQIQVESEVNKGTIFTICLPIRTTAHSGESNNEDAIHTDRVQADGVETDFSDMDTFRTERISINSNFSKSDLHDSDKPILLIIDDNRDIIYYLSSLLEDQYMIETAYNGADGIALAQEGIPDIIISDILMPGLDGYDLCDTLKKDERTSHIPIILLTAKADITSRVSGLRVGADAYLSKPFDEMELQVQLENLLRLRKSLQVHYQKKVNNLAVTIDLPKPIEDAFLTKLNGIILEKMDDEDFGILQLCRAMQMSRTQLHRKITALTGKSTSIYLRSLRLQKAKQLLKKPDMNISQVAFAVGYSDPNYFTRTFTEEFGITPSGFRAEG